MRWKEVLESCASKTTNEKKKGCIEKAIKEAVSMKKRAGTKTNQRERGRKKEGERKRLNRGGTKEERHPLARHCRSLLARDLGR